MKRYLLVLAVASLGFLLLLGVVYALLDTPSPSAPRLARARALFETENYLNALQVLLSVTGDESAPETRVYLGAAYLKLHLYQAALEQFQAAGRETPGSLDPWIGLAMVHLRLGDAAAALEGAVKAVDVAAGSTDAWLVFARAHWFHRDLVQAETAALKVHELDPGNLQATELLLRIHFERHDSDKFQALMDATPHPNRPIEDLAVQFALRHADFQRAYDLRSRFDRRALQSQILRTELALAREPAQTDLYPGLIRDLVKVGRFEDALEAAGRYRGPVPVDLDVAKAHWLAGNYDQAIRSFRAASAGRTHKLAAEVALAILTGDARHWIEAFRAEWSERDMFVLARLSDLAKTGSSLEKSYVYRYAALFDAEFFNTSAEHALAVLKDDPDHFEAMMTLATAYHRIGRIDDAFRYVEQGRDLHPERAEVWSRLGELALLRGDGPSAAQYLERAVRLAPSNPNTLYNFGWILDQMDRDAEAVLYYERAIAASPLSFESMNNLALIEGDNGRPERAIRLLNQAVAANPENEISYFNRGNYYTGTGAWRLATQDYNRVLAIDPANVYARIELGRIHMQLDRIDQAIDELNRALEIDANAHEAYLLMSSAYEKIGREHEAAAAFEEARRIQPDTKKPETATP